MAELGLASAALGVGFLNAPSFTSPPSRTTRFSMLFTNDRRFQLIRCSTDGPRKLKPTGKKEHHLWMKRDSSGSGQKALNLTRIVSNLPNEKDAMYGALDRWAAWETEFPVIAAAKALEILRRRNEWLRIIQVFADMEELGVKPDEDTVRRVGRAFEQLGQVDKQKLLLKRYQGKWKYLHFNGERVRVLRKVPNDEQIRS